MINVNETTQNLYKQDSVPKGIELTINDKTYTNSDIVANSFEYSAIWVDDENEPIKFRYLPRDTFTITIANATNINKGDIATLAFVISGGEKFTKGRFVVKEIKKIENKPYATYEFAHKSTLLDFDMSTIYDKYVGMSLKNAGDNLYSDILDASGVELIWLWSQKYYLNTRSFVLRSRVNNEKITASQFVQDLLELDGRLISRDLYSVVSANTIPYRIEDYVKIERPKIYNGDIVPAVRFVEGHNRFLDRTNSQVYYDDISIQGDLYNFENNRLLRWSDWSGRIEALKSTIQYMSNFSFEPIKELVVNGLPFLEVGDMISFNYDGRVVNTRIMSYTIKGINNMKMTIKSRVRNHYSSVIYPSSYTENEKEYRNGLVGLNQIDGIQANVNILQSDINSLQTNEGILGADINALQTSFNNMQSDVETMQTSIDTLNENLKRIITVQSGILTFEPGIAIFTIEHEDCGDTSSVGRFCELLRGNISASSTITACLSSTHTRTSTTVVIRNEDTTARTGRINLLIVR